MSVNIYLFKVNKVNNCEICLKLTQKFAYVFTEYRNDVVLVSLSSTLNIFHMFLVFLLLTMSIYLFAQKFLITFVRSMARPLQNHLKCNK